MKQRSLVLAIAISLCVLSAVLIPANGAGRASAIETTRAAVALEPGWHEMSLAQANAQQIFEFALTEPEYVPEGWVREAGAVEAIPELSDPGSVAFYRYEIGWAPATALATDHVGLIFSQAPDTGRPDDLATIPTATLDDGTTVYVSEWEGPQPGGGLSWWKDDVYYFLSSAGLSVETLMTIANSVSTTTVVPVTEK